MDIKVGEYVRTNKGYIYKIKKIRKSDVSEEVYIVRAHEDNYSFYLRKENITKYSKNIIDLIEVGDIVFIQDVLNNDFVYIYDDEMLKAVREDIEEGLQITKILTHQHFEQNCYKTTKQQT